jgi:hypothetical protein
LSICCRPPASTSSCPGPTPAPKPEQLPHHYGSGARKALTVFKYVSPIYSAQVCDRR